MKAALEAIRAAAHQQLTEAKSLKELDDLRVKFLGKKGELTAILKRMGGLSAEERPVVGRLANQIRESVEGELTARTQALKAALLEEKLRAETIDVTMPGSAPAPGHRHPVSLVLDEVKESIMNAYEIKTGMGRARISHLMDAESWFNARKAVELGFADGVLRGDGTEDKARGGEPEGVMFSRMAVTNSLLSKLIPEHKETEKKVPVEQLEKRLQLLSH